MLIFRLGIKLSPLGINQLNFLMLMETVSCQAAGMTIYVYITQEYTLPQ